MRTILFTVVILSMTGFDKTKNMYQFAGKDLDSQKSMNVTLDSAYRPYDTVLVRIQVPNK